MSQKWTARQLAFIEWLAIPTKSRKPKTQQALARKLGVNRKTLGRWKKLDGFYAAVYAEARSLLDGRLPGILDALGGKAEEGDVPAIRTALEVTGRHVPRREITGKDGGPLQAVVATDDLSNLTDEEMDARLDKLFDQATEAGAGEAGDGAEEEGGSDGH